LPIATGWITWSKKWGRVFFFFFGYIYMSSAMEKQNFSEFIWKFCFSMAYL